MSVRDWLKRKSIDRALPQTVEAFDVWCEKLLTSYGFENKNANKHEVANAVLHLKNEEHWAPDEFFAQKLSRRVANDVAFKVMRRLEAEYKESLKAMEEEAKNQAVTVQPVEIGNETASEAEPGI